MEISTDLFFKDLPVHITRRPSVL